MSTLSTPVEVFYSFAEADTSYLKQLEHHLSVLRHEGQITGWHKRRIAAGRDWQLELDRHLTTASLILLLISPDFLSSDYQYGVELQRAMQRHDANEARVIPILVRACDWEGTPFSKLQPVPRNGKAITSWRNRDEAYTDVAKEILVALQTMQGLTPSMLPTALPKVWQVPYRRNPIFSGREDLLHVLEQALEREHSAILSQPQAISGLGGIGKTGVAVEYAYRVAQHYQAVLWVSAETRETLVSGYVAIARELNLREKDEQDQDLILHAVRHWLQHHSDWLLILDNADDLSLVEQLLPPVFGGRVLLTTRAQATGVFAHRIVVEVLDTSIGALLLLRRAGILSAQESLQDAGSQDVALARQISEELGGLPLALDQAGAYIEETGCSLRDYQQRYRESHAVLLKRRGGLNSNHPVSVAATWSLAFEKIEQQNVTAANLLQLCAFLSPDAIPVSVLVSLANDPLHFEEAIATLRAYSLVQYDGVSRTLFVHRLVQAVLKDNLKDVEKRMWAERAVRAVYGALPGVKFEEWNHCEQMLPHAQKCALLIDKEEMAFAEAALVLHWIGAYFLARARSQEAEQFLQQSLVLWEKHLDRKHPEMATILNSLARWRQRQGREEEAEALLRRALSITEQQLGPDHPDTATILNRLAGSYNHLGREEEAEALLRRALSIRERKLGPEHPLTGESLNNLAMIYIGQWRYAEAEPLFRQALSIWEKKSGPDHPDTASCLSNLGLLYSNQERYAEAEAFYRRALSIREQQLGAEHPLTGESLNNLAILYENQRKYAEAEYLFRRVLDTIEDRPSARIVRENAAQFLQMMEYRRKQKGWRKVLKFFRL